METTNPLFRNVELRERSSGTVRVASVERITLNGTLYKAGILLLCVAMSALRGWRMFEVPQDRRTTVVIVVVLSACVFGAMALVWLTVRKKAWSPFTAPVYALLEGWLMGDISAGANRRYPGIAIQAVAVTIAMSFGLLVAYRSGLIRVTEGFNRKLTAAIGGVALFYLTTFVLALMGVRIFSVFAEGVPGILISVIVIVIAGLSLVSAFDFVARCAQADLPKYMEWYAAFGLVMTLIWLYMEILNLLAKARRGTQGSA